MHPPAEDNYGTDACSLLCIHSTPPVLVIATSDGNLYHCVVLNKGEDDDSLSEVSWTGTEASTQYDTLSETSLYVYERVELELSLTTVAVETDELIEDDFTCPIRLHTDPSTKDRYHCLHSAGVHAVVLPWLNRLQDFTESSSESLLEVGQQEAVVEHIICTKPLPSSPACPVMGLDIVDNHLLGTTLIILTAAMECLTVPLV
ncbi:nuclear pore complex protein Nup88-like [Lingula anatina]|uniref:Nuclear pore complex protein Nup88-like n=1 Tax=Lingula anatina TaxID=7574 RepID=A0A1S3IQ16_LINAN|nr:nuclear pore complex protein Nup88-like [Lingula anatina]|eukprot:XP_013400315.2 nuclear pore complex protein Nup88-like [Lingula anatina]